jgi:hypothetical protein
MPEEFGMLSSGLEVNETRLSRITYQTTLGAKESNAWEILRASIGCSAQEASVFRHE